MTATPPEDLRYRVALHRVHRLGSARFALIERAFPSFEAMWRAGASALAGAGLDERTAQELLRAR
ncbi:MAG: hypothetical protein EXR65_05840 [Dehalococcoidia bacterium]|nr:hypothetical protein [Dehalococcoidia bacterium]